MAEQEKAAAEDTTAEAEIDANDAPKANKSNGTSGQEMRAQAVEHSITVPPGALKMFRNRMQYVWYELTDDPNDPLINKPEQTFMPTALQQGSSDTPSREERAKLKNAVAFSHLTGDQHEFQNIECVFEPVPNANPNIDGVMFDKRSLDVTQGFDTHFDVHDDGNILAMFLVQKGWVEHFYKNLVCHRCGTFPAYNKCLSCNGGAFCGDECLLRSKMTDIHCVEVCDRFVDEKVKKANPVLLRKKK